ncbi:MAG: dihydroorotate dehydrogenase electron transfer subunit [Dehalococcoidia bacterium]|nr:dihydroorotate dehydrogenase electron transfer subunit [Dehalococcoidia bacterium]
MRLFAAIVISVKEIASGRWLLWLAVPPEGAQATAGQFYMLRCSEGLDPLLRRPIAFHRTRFSVSPYGNRPDVLPDVALGQREDFGLPGGEFSRELDTARLPSPFVAVAFLVAKAGRGTAWLVSRRPGDVVDTLGPLGSGYAISPGSRHLLLLAGGMGIAPLVALAEAAVARDLSVTLLLGAASKDQAYPAEFLPPQVEVVLATDDGSAGTKGVVTDLLPAYLDWADQIFACGPVPMYASLASILVRSTRRKSVQISIEERMACGVGACLSCSVETRHGIKTACKDGPVLELKEVFR